jgi:hypothetical protein
MEEARLRPVGDMWDFVGQFPDSTAPVHSCDRAAGRIVASDRYGGALDVAKVLAWFQVQLTQGTFR